MKIIFVGVHNKPGKQPLDSSTKSGKIIDKIISELPGHEFIKSNLYDIEMMPSTLEKYKLKWQYMDRFISNPDNDEAIFVLLGAAVHTGFPKASHQKKIKLAHPASSIYTRKKDAQYILESVQKIRACL